MSTASTAVSNRGWGMWLGVRLVAAGALLLGLFLPAASLAAAPDGRPALVTAAGTYSHASVVRAYGHLPISFEINRGQVDRQVVFLARAGGITLFLTRGAVFFQVSEAGASSQSGPSAGSVQPVRDSRPLREKTIGMLLLHANAHPQVVGLDPLRGRVSYIIGNDPAKWHTNIPTYGEVLYRNIYPGIDLRFHGTGGQLEYDWVVRPGGNPTAIRVRLAGAGTVRLDSRGDLRWGAGSAQLVQGRPTAYQLVGGRRVAVTGRFALRGDQLGLALGRYDRHHLLVIDPTIRPTYSTYLGGGGDDHGFAIAVDSTGNAYVTGATNSINLPKANPYQANYGGINDAFVTKLDPTGTSLVYSTYLGGYGYDQGNGIAVDSAGNVYVAGWTESTNFPTTAGAFQTAYGGSNDAFVTKLNPTGSGLVYSTYLGGSGNDLGLAIAVDSAGDVYVTGHTSGSFLTTAGASQTSYGGGSYDAFVTKLNAAGTAPDYSTYLGGSGDDEAYGIAVDASGNAYVTGFTKSSDFPTTTGAFQTTFGGYHNAFVTKLNAAGNARVYSTFLGGSGNDQGNGIALDGTGNAYVTGQTSSFNFPTTAGAFQATFSGADNAFVTKLNNAGTALDYSTFLGGSGDDEGYGIAVDILGSAYVTGVAGSSDFPTVNPYQATSGGTLDAFEATLDANGATLLYSTYLGGGGIDRGYGIALDASRDVYVTGYASSPDFPTTSMPFQGTYGGGPSDAFITKFPTAYAPTISATPVVAPSSSSTISWDTGNGGIGQVWVKVDGGTESLFGQGASGSYPAPWIASGHTYTFSLYAGTTHTAPALTSASVSLTIPPAAITASPNPVTSGHSTVIEWSTGSTTVGQVWVSQNGRADALVTTGPYGELLIPWILPGYGYVFKLYGNTTHTGPPLSSVTVRASSPTIVASANPVSGGGSTTLDWSTGDGSSGTLCVSANGGTVTAASGTASDASVVSGVIASTDVDLYTLHAGAGCGGTTLASTRVTGTGATYIAANPSQVVNSTGTAISWNTGSAAIGQVWVAEDGATEVLVIQGVSGSVSIPWLQAGHSYVFTLYAGTSHTPGSGTPLASVTVTPFNFPSISATPNPVTSGNSTTVSWDTGESSTGEVWVSVNGGAETLVARNPKGSISPSWIQPGVIYTFTLYQGTSHSVKLATVTVTHS